MKNWPTSKILTFASIVSIAIGSVVLASYSGEIRYQLNLQESETKALQEAGFDKQLAAVGIYEIRRDHESLVVMLKDGTKANRSVCAWSTSKANECNPYIYFSADYILRATPLGYSGFPARERWPKDDFIEAMSRDLDLAKKMATDLEAKSGTKSAIKKSWE